MVPPANCIYRVTMDHNSSSGDFITVQEGEFVEVLEASGSNYLVVTIRSDTSDDVEGYIPVHFLAPLDYQSLNTTNNNNSCTVCVKEPKALKQEWANFCTTIGRYEHYPQLETESDLLNAKIKSLVLYAESANVEGAGDEGVDGGNLPPHVTSADSLEDNG